MVRQVINANLTLSVTQWHTLLSIATVLCSEHSRQDEMHKTRTIIWEIVRVLIVSHYVNLSNFTSIRHLVLRYLHG